MTEEKAICGFISLGFYIGAFYLLNDITWLEFIGVLCFMFGAIFAKQSNK